MCTYEPIVWGVSLIFIAGVSIVVSSLMRDAYKVFKEERS